MKKIRLSRKEIKNLLIRFIFLVIFFYFLVLPISLGNTFILEYSSQMSSRITNFQVLDLPSNETNFSFTIDYQIYNSGPFMVYCGKSGGGSSDLFLPFTFSSSNVNLENVSIYDMAGGTLAGGVDRIKPGIHNYTSTYELSDANQVDYNFTLPDGEYYFTLGKLTWNEICGVNFTITAENYTVNYELPIETWDSDVLYLGDPFLFIYGCVFIIILIGPIIFKNLKKQPNQLKESKLLPDPIN